MSYHVLVDDTFCSTDKSHRYTTGEYETYGEALAVCREIVDRFLRHECAPGVPASAVYFRYMMFGKDPSIVEYLGVAGHVGGLLGLGLREGPLRGVVLPPRREDRPAHQQEAGDYGCSVSLKTSSSSSDLSSGFPDSQFSMINSE